MQIYSHGITDRGRVRTENEDALFIDQAHQVYAVADGLGGLPGGARCSTRIVELLSQAFTTDEADINHVDLAELIIGINRIITAEGISAHPFTGSGSTLSIGQIIQDQFLIGHVGDSAIYLLRHGNLEKVTVDHTMEQEYIDRLGEEARDAMPRDYPHTLTRCVGQGDEMRVDQTRFTLESGDRILLCTDGLNKVLNDLEIRAVLESGYGPKVIAETLVEKANASKGPDNITIIVLIIE